MNNSKLKIHNYFSTAMHSKLIFDKRHLEITINRLCFQLIENHDLFTDTVIIGLQSRGVYLSRRIHKLLCEVLNNPNIEHGELDVSFHRDDFRRRELINPSRTHIDFILENKNVIVVDDVLYTGRTIRAGLDAMLSFGRPAKVELLVLIDRKFSRHLPIAPNYVGKSIDTILTDKIKVQWQETEGEDGVWMLTEDKAT